MHVSGNEAPESQPRVGAKQTALAINSRGMLPRSPRGSSTKSRGTHDLPIGVVRRKCPSRSPIELRNECCVESESGGGTAQALSPAIDSDIATDSVHRKSRRTHRFKIEVRDGNMAHSWHQNP